MSTPVVERPRAGTATRTAPTRTAPAAPRRAAPGTPRKAAPGAPRKAAPGAPTRTAAPRRTASSASGDATLRTARRRSSLRAPARAASTGRAQFVLTVMVLLGVGLVATLWLSTAAAADSYRLQDARTAARELTERSERLHREVAALESPPALAQRAAQLGMVPAKDPARLVVAADGGVQVVGTPTPAVAQPGGGMVPDGLGGAVAPAARSVPAPEVAVGQVAAAAVAAAQPAADAARKAEEEAQNGPDANGQDGAEQNSADQNSADQNSADQNSAGQNSGAQNSGDRDSSARNSDGGQDARNAQDATEHDATGQGGARSGNSRASGGDTTGAGTARAGAGGG